MTLRVTPWGKDNFKATSGEAEAKDWAYWQNRMNRASLVMLAEEGIISPDIASRIAAAQKTCRRYSEPTRCPAAHGHHAVRKNADRILL